MLPPRLCPVQPLDLMEIACLYALCGVLGVKANKIHGQDAQNAQGEQVAHLWTYTFLFTEEPYIEAFKHFLLGTGNFFQLQCGAPIVCLAQSAGLLSFSTPIDAIYLACVYAFCTDLIEHCRRENGSMHIPPMETSFGHLHTSLLSQVKNS